MMLGKGKTIVLDKNFVYINLYIASDILSDINHVHNSLYDRISDETGMVMMVKLNSNVQEFEMY